MYVIFILMYVIFMETEKLSNLLKTIRLQSRVGGGGWGVCGGGVQAPILLFQVQLILIIHRFCIWEFACLLKFSWNPQMTTRGTFLVIPRHVQSDKKLESPNEHIPSCS